MMTILLNVSEMLRSSPVPHKSPHKQGDAKPFLDQHARALTSPGVRISVCVLLLCYQEMSLEEKA